MILAHPPTYLVSGIPLFSLFAMQLIPRLIRMNSMGRRPRIHYPGAVYHVMAHGVEGQDIFHDDVDRVRFMEDLRSLVRESGASLLAYCLMGNHFHLAIQVGTITLSLMMQRLLTRHSKAYNQRHGRKGHLFWGRHEAIPCTDEKYLAALIRYIHLNPVKGGLVTKAADWPWSSLDGKPMPEDAAYDIDEFDPRAQVEESRPILIRPAPIDIRGIDDLGKDISNRTGITIAEMRSNDSRRPVVAAKRLLTLEAVSYGHRLITIARWLKSSPATLTRYAKKKVKKVECLTPSTRSRR